MAYLDQITRRCGLPMLQRALGERTDENQPLEVFYLAPGAETPFAIREPIVTELKRTTDYNPATGEVVAQERRTVVVGRDQLELGGETKPVRGARLTLAPDDVWLVDPDTSEWGQAIVTLGLVRKVLEAQQEMRAVALTFNPAAPRSPGGGAIYATKLLIAECAVFQELSESADDSAAAEKISVGVGETPWDGKQFTKEQLETDFCRAHLYPPDEDDQAISMGDKSLVKPHTGGVFVLMVRRIARETEANDKEGLWLAFFDCCEALREQIMTLALPRECPRLRWVRRHGAPGVFVARKRGRAGVVSVVRILDRLGRPGGRVNMALVQCKLELSGLAAIPPSVRREVFRIAIFKAGEHWHAKFLPIHFTNEAYARYSYERRKSGYERAKRMRHANGQGKRATGEVKPHVWSGESRERATKTRNIVAKAASHTRYYCHVNLNVPVFNFRNPNSSVNQRREITTINNTEERILAGVFQVAAVNEFKNRGQTHRIIRVIKAA